VAARTTAPEQPRAETAETVAKIKWKRLYLPTITMAHPTAAINGAGRRRPSDGRAGLPSPSFDRAGAGVGGGVRPRKPPRAAGAR